MRDSLILAHTRSRSRSHLRFFILASFVVQADQLASLSEAWTEADQPTAACCQTLKQFADAACVCDPSLQALLPSVGVNIEPITAVLGAAGEACGTFTVAPCP